MLCRHNPAPHPRPRREAALTLCLPVTFSIARAPILRMVVFYLTSCTVASKLGRVNEERDALPAFPAPCVLTELGLAGANSSLRPAVLQKSPSPGAGLLLCGPLPRLHSSQRVSKFQPQRTAPSPFQVLPFSLGVGVGGWGPLPGEKGGSLAEGESIPGGRGLPEAVRLLAQHTVTREDSLATTHWAA